MGKAESFLNSWLRHRLVLIELVDLIPEEHLDFKPWEKAMTLKELVLHITFATDLFVEAVRQEKFIPPDSSQPEIHTVADLRHIVHEVTEKTKSTITSFTDKQFEILVDVTKPFGSHLPGEVLLHMIRDHEIHHKGQLFVYARMIGVENIPSFAKREIEAQ
jgi:uncharacterized damage-inducible protein DinB